VLGAFSFITDFNKENILFSTSFKTILLSDAFLNKKEIQLNQT